MEPIAEPIPFIPATEADYLAIIDLTNRAYRGIGPEASWNVENVIEGQRLDASLLRDDLAANPDARLLLWREQDGSLLGCVWLEPVSNQTSNETFNETPNEIWYLGLLAVEPRLQKRQLGRTLLAAAEDYAREHGALRIRMTVLHLRDTLIAWYQRRGYALTGETKPFPYDDERFGRPLRDDLHFVVMEKPLQAA
jgi:ribosomal protein S18 acetylase RimI-like enzyme